MLVTCKPLPSVNFVNSLAQNLADFDGNRKPLEYYRAFAWKGLGENPQNGSPITQAWNNLTESEKNDILSKQNTMDGLPDISCN